MLVPKNKNIQTFPMPYNTAFFLIGLTVTPLIIVKGLECKELTHFTALQNFK